MIQAGNFGGLDHGRGILARRSAMGGDRTAVAEEPTGGASQGRPPSHQRHHPRAQSGVPLAGLSGGLWPADDDLQSLSSLGAARDLEAPVCRAGEERSRRDCLRRYPSWSFTSFLDSCSHASLCLWIISCHKSPSAKGTPRFRGSGGSSSGTSLRYQTNTVNNLNQYTQRTVPEATVSPH